MPKQTTTLTQMEIEKLVLASLIDPVTAAKAKAQAEKLKLGPEMFTVQRLRETFETWMRMGCVPFDGFVEGEAASKLSVPDAATFKGLVAHIVRRYRQKLKETDRTLDEFQTPGKDEDDDDCLFRGRWLRRGGCGFIISTSGVGKSSLTMQMAVQWAAGEPMLGITPMRALKIGIVQSEDDEYDVANFRDRIRIGLRTELNWPDEKIGQAEARVTFMAWNGSTGAAFVEYIRQKQLAYHFDLVIVNPLHAFFGGDLKNGDEVSRFLRNGIDRVLKDEDTKCGIFFVHHTGKPTKEALNNGDYFAAYMGNGSGELTNYTRVALTLLPFKEGKVPGVFELIGSKHGDKLGWTTADGKRTNKKTVCYANRLERHAKDGAIFWLEPNADDMEALEASATQKRDENVYKTIATALAETFKLRRINGPARWVEVDCVKENPTFKKWSKRERVAGLKLLDCNPDSFGVRIVEDGKTRYYEAIQTPEEDKHEAVEF